MNGELNFVNTARLCSEYARRESSALLLMYLNTILGNTDDASYILAFYKKRIPLCVGKRRRYFYIIYLDSRNGSYGGWWTTGMM